jgi:hypothetical protein
VSSKSELARRQRRWADARGIRYDARGCVLELADNLREPPSGVLLAQLQRGSELTAQGLRPARGRSLCSSAALVVNVFGHWQARDAAPLLRALGLEAASATLSFEEPLPTGLPGDAPLADVALERHDGAFVAIESKFAEWLARRPRNKSGLKAKYFPPGGAVWTAASLPRCQSLAEDLQAGRERFRFLHAAQLLKQALGLAKRGARPAVLLYLYYDWPGRETATHTTELERVRVRLAGEVDLRVLTYQALYRALRASDGVDGPYLEYLAERYFGR